MDFSKLKEIDINPFAVDEEGGSALDAHIVLDEKVPIMNFIHILI
jgi:hypothetical protein